MNVIYKAFWKKTVVAYSKYYPSITSERLETSIRINCVLTEIPAFPEQKSMELTFGQPTSWHRNRDPKKMTYM
jgi:hypothetical protein